MQKTEPTPIAARTRLDWIDALRAIAMFFVVCVHSCYGQRGWWIYNVFIGPLMLPLFFAISGYLFNHREGNQAKFFKGMLLKLIIPWFVLSFNWLRLLLIPVKGFHYWYDHFYSLVSGNLSWFMPALVIGEVVFFYIRKFCKKPLQVAVACCVVTVLGFVLHFVGVGEFAMFNRALIAQSFLLIGYLCRQHQDRLARVGKGQLAILAAAYLGLGVLSCALMPGQYIDVHLNQYQSILLCFAMIFIGCTALFIAAPRISRYPRWLVFLGQNTLVCYFFHLKGLQYIYKAFLRIGLDLTNNWIFSGARAVGVIIACALASLVINRIFPEGVGRRRIRKSAKA